jgi:NTE family protein
MINNATSAAAQRELADVLLKPPLANVDLLNWHAFDRAIEAGYEYARRALESLPAVPRLAPAAGDRTSRSSLVAELERRLAASIEAG